jgi:hypothetical protein
MTSLIFGSLFLAHDGIVKHRREKQRQKNYERWEGLRDEYDEMKKITTQRTSGEYQDSVQHSSNDRGIFTLRDQQEAGDARTSWRPQEGWERRESSPSPRNSAQLSRNGSVSQNTSVLKPQKTGATWDEGIPARLPVSKRNWDENGQLRADNHNLASMNTSSSSINSHEYGRRSEDFSRRSVSVEREPERRKDEEVDVVESPFDWWKQ